jgi:predicted small lipoprotein YifL
MFRAVDFLACLSLLAPLAACGDQGPDETPPGIESTVPADSAGGVASDTDLVIQFDEAIDRNSINDTIFHAAQGQQSLFGQVSYDLNRHLATLSLSIDLQAGVTYQGVLEPGVKDLLGNRRAEVFRWSFTVAE